MHQSIYCNHYCMARTLSTDTDRKTVSRLLLLWMLPPVAEAASTSTPAVTNRAGTRTREGVLASPNYSGNLRMSGLTGTLALPIKLV
jgi:hypothetical protein